MELSHLEEVRYLTGTNLRLYWLKVNRLDSLQPRGLQLRGHSINRQVKCPNNKQKPYNCSKRLKEALTGKIKNIVSKEELKFLQTPFDDI